MRIIGTTIVFSVIMVFSSCDKRKTEIEYKFTKDYCATVRVGGIVGIQEKCFSKKDIVIAEVVSDSSIIIRIAEHSERNESTGPWNYQELLEVPKEYVKEKRKEF